MFMRTGFVGRQFPGGGGLRPSMDIGFSGGALDSRIVFLRASTATDGMYTDAAGSTYNSYAINQPRNTVNGLLIEEPRTNYLLNSDAPVTQTTASLVAGTYTLWMVGTGSVVSSAGTAVGSGFGTAISGTPNVITITTAGTVIVTVTAPCTRFQLENGAFPTSYIPTTGATANRAVDDVSMPSSSFVNTTAGTVYLETANTMPSTATIVFGGLAGPGGFSDTFYFAVTSGSSNLGASCLVSGAGQSVTKVASYVANAITKMVATYTANRISLSVNGTSVVQNGASPAGPFSYTQRFRFGGSPWVGVPSSAINGYMRRARYWPRALADTELQQVTT